MKNRRQIFKVLGNWTCILLFMMTLFTPQLSAQTDSVEWHPFEEAIQIAEENQQFILVDVWAPWCGWCKKMQKEVYPELSKGFSEKFVWTRINRDDHESDIPFNHQTFTPLRLAQKLNVQSVPALVFLSSKGEYILHISGFTEAEKLTPVLEYVESGAYQMETYESFITGN